MVVTRIMPFYWGDTYTEATKPADANQGSVIYVSDGAAGANFQGWDGAGWVPLG